jgi:2'-5' RNA ligase
VVEKQSPESWRLFVAISLPEPVKAELSRVQLEIRHSLSAGCVRWARQEQFHITLKFLGQVEARRTLELSDSLQDACRGFPALQLSAEGIGFFPNARAARVIWAGVRDKAECLPLLQQSIEESVRGVSAEKPESRFSGHVTLGRCQLIKWPDREMLSRFAGKTGLRFGEWTAHKVELIRSELLPQGSRYTTVATIPLATEPPFGKLPPR